MSMEDSNQSLESLMNQPDEVERTFGSGRNSGRNRKLSKRERKRNAKRLKENLIYGNKWERELVLAFSNGKITPNQYFSIKDDEEFKSSTRGKWLRWHLEEYHRKESESDFSIPLEVELINEWEEKFGRVKKSQQLRERAWLDERDLIQNYLGELDKVKEERNLILDSNNAEDLDEIEGLDNVLQNIIEDKVWRGRVRREIEELDERKRLAHDYLKYVNEEIKKWGIKEKEDTKLNKLGEKIKNNGPTIAASILGLGTIAGVGLLCNTLNNITPEDVYPVSPEHSQEEVVDGAYTDSVDLIDDFVSFDMSSFVEKDVPNAIAESGVYLGENLNELIPEDRAEIYTVERGDNLWRIAVEHIEENNLDFSVQDVVDDIVYDNNIEDPNYIEVGEELVIDTSNLDTQEALTEEISDEREISQEDKWDIYDLSECGVPFETWELQWGNSLYEMVEDSLRSISQDPELNDILNITNPGWEDAFGSADVRYVEEPVVEEVELGPTIQDEYDFTSLERMIERLDVSEDFSNTAREIEQGVWERISLLENKADDLENNGFYSEGERDIYQRNLNDQISELERIQDLYDEALDSVEVNIADSLAVLEQDFAQDSLEYMQDEEVTIEQPEELARQPILEDYEFTIFEPQEIDFVTELRPELPEVDARVDSLRQALDSFDYEAQRIDSSIVQENLEYEELSEIVPYNISRANDTELDYSELFGVPEVELPEELIRADSLRQALDMVERDYLQEWGLEQDEGISLQPDSQYVQIGEWPEEFVAAGSQEGRTGGIDYSPNDLMAETDISHGIVSERENFYNSGVDVVSVYQTGEEDILFNINPFQEGYNVSDYDVILADSEMREISSIDGLEGIQEIALSEFGANLEKNQDYLIFVKGILEDEEGWIMGDYESGTDITLEWFKLRPSYSGERIRLD